MSTQTIIPGAESFEKPNGALAIVTPMRLLEIATSQGADLEKLKQLMDLQERWERNEARKAFVEAMSAFKSHAIQVVKDKTNSQYGSKYVSLGNLVNTVTPFLSQHGLSVRWDISQTNGIEVSCIVTHVQGHSESVSITFPPDKSGSKNPIQEIKSAITYAKACTFESITGMASTDANVDDDGNGAGLPRFDDLSERLEFIANCRNLEELERVFKDAYKAAGAAKDQNAQRQLIQAKDTRKGQIRSGR